MQGSLLMVLTLLAAAQTLLVAGLRRAFIGITPWPPARSAARSRWLRAVQPRSPLFCRGKPFSHTALQRTQQLCVRVRQNSDFVGWQHAPSFSCALDVASVSILSDT